jgi:hypothetical protein
VAYKKKLEEEEFAKSYNLFVETEVLLPIVSESTIDMTG